MMEAAAGARVIHSVQSSAVCAEPETVAAVLVDGEQLVLAQRGRVLLPVREMNEGACLFIQQVQTVAVGAQPEVFFAVDEDVADIVAAETGGITVTMCVLAAAVAVRLEVDDALIFRAYPEIAGIVFRQAGDDIAGDRGGAGIFSKSGELIGGAIVPVQTSSPGADPDIAAMIFDNVGDEIIADAAFDPGVVAIDGDLVTVVSVEAVAGAEPYESAAVLEDVEDIVLREAVIYVQVFEFEAGLLGGGKMTCTYSQQERQYGGFDGIGHAIQFQGFLRVIV